MVRVGACIICPRQHLCRKGDLMTTQSNRVTPRWKAIYQQLHEELASYKYGADFYTIGQICKKFEVSQITAIRVLNELASRHLIEKIPGRGNIVQQINQPVAIRTIFPADAHRDLLTFDYPTSRRLDGIATAAREQGLDYGILSETHLASLFPRQREGPVFGFLLLHQVSRQTRMFLQTHDIPHVLVDPIQRYKGIPHARVDRESAGYLAARHLLEQGHRRIGWITGPITSRNFRARIVGYRRALKEAGIAFDWTLLKEVESTGPNCDSNEVRRKLEELLAVHRPPTAIIAGDDNRAIHILNACRQMGIDVPGQLSVLGYPNNPEASLASPPLSVIDAHFEKVGQASVKLLIEQMLGGADPASQKVLIAPELVTRQSTGSVTSAKKRKRAMTGV